jgi:hypothetical protein
VGVTLGGDTGEIIGSAYYILKRDKLRMARGWRGTWYAMDVFECMICHWMISSCYH